MDDLKISEDDEAIDEKSKSTATTKKGPIKRSAPASGKKNCCYIREKERSN